LRGVPQPPVVGSFRPVARRREVGFAISQRWPAARAGEFTGLPVRITIGAADPFTPAVRTFRDRLADRGVVPITGGCHDDRFWRSAAPAQVRAVSRALAS
jgi:hypothetical protein